MDESKNNSECGDLCILFADTKAREKGYQSLRETSNLRKERDDLLKQVNTWHDQFHNSIKEQKDGTLILVWTKEELEAAKDAAESLADMFGFERKPTRDELCNQLEEQAAEHTKIIASWSVQKTNGFLQKKNSWWRLIGCVPIHCPREVNFFILDI